MKRPRVLYVTFHREGGNRCCSFDTMKELREAHPADRYDVVAYVPRPMKRKSVRAKEV